MRFRTQLLLLLLLIFIFSLIFILIVFETVIEVKNENKRCVSGVKGLPTIYVVTPTYARHVQEAELVRLSHTLALVDAVHWILVEDSPNKTQTVTTFLSRIQTYGQLAVTHLNVQTPNKYKMKSTDPNWLKPRGVLQRNAALNWLRQNEHLIDKNGVLYFADDDNTYDLKLFSEMRFTKTVSVFAVGLVGGLPVERPIVKDGKVVAWNAIWKPKRKFPIDMSGFAVNVKLLLRNKNAMFSLNVERGFQETYLLNKLVNNISELEPKANDCTEILVWHTRTQEPKLIHQKKLKFT